MIIVLDRIVAVAGYARRTLTGLGRLSWLARVAVIAVLTVLVATAVSAVLVLRTPERLAPVALDPPPEADLPTTAGFGGPGSEARPAASSPPETTPTATGSAPPGALPVAPPATHGPSAATAPTTPAMLRATFAIEEPALLSYGASVTISNAGQTEAMHWQLIITLPRESLDITSITGARATRAGATWTFVPDESTGQIPGDASVRVTFRVSGASINSAPKACTIDGAACAGLPD
ncbi:cellulose binding domain-containing protein [Micromonospora sp. NPDC050200]|uniref:cellulose binding domain-containing protein n=1 Tax=Micromonospora sp. NPDC050200 TaxID=3155664 RepID=UPI0033EB0293